MQIVHADSFALFLFRVLLVKYHTKALSTLNKN